MKRYLDATTLIALGEVGELDLLTTLDGRLCILSSVEDEVTTEPADSNLRRSMTRIPVSLSGVSVDTFDETQEAKEEARRILGEDEMSGDLAMVTVIVKLESKGICRVE